VPAMLDHLGIIVSDYDRSKAFYAKALEPLGAKLLMEFPQVGGFGVGQKPTFWISAGASFFTGGAKAGAAPIHVCFVAKDRAQVDAFHAAAMAAGGKDFGAPGVRAQYHPNYYGAFVLDPDGNNVEACHHGG
jgi:catechol 2,3-dioxygenase-like lactoylglutathione lyase family enzyme